MNVISTNVSPAKGLEYVIKSPKSIVAAFCDDQVAILYAQRAMQNMEIEYVLALEPERNSIIGQYVLYKIVGRNERLGGNRCKASIKEHIGKIYRHSSTMYMCIGTSDDDLILCRVGDGWTFKACYWNVNGDEIDWATSVGGKFPD